MNTTNVEMLLERSILTKKRNPEMPKDVKLNALQNDFLECFVLWPKKIEILIFPPKRNTDKIRIKLMQK